MSGRRNVGRAGRTRPPVGLAVVLAILLQAAAPSPVIAGMVRTSAEVRSDPASGTDVLGLRVQPFNCQAADQAGALSGQGVVVEVVEQGGTAGMAGVRPGDVIRQVNRWVVRSVGDFERAMGEIAQGELVRLWIRRGGTSLLIILILEP